MNEKKFFLTPNEFSVISAGFGLSMVYGLKQIDGRLDSKEICMALHNMYVNNVIENPESKQFVTDPDITAMMRCIKASRFLLRMETVLGNSECVLCLYPSAPCVVVEENALYTNKVILYTEDSRQLIEALAKETANKKIQLCVMSTTNGEVIREECVHEKADIHERVAALTKCYESTC